MKTVLKPYLAANRNVLIAGAVLMFHALAIWALQTGLLLRAVETVVPVEVLAQIVDSPAPKADPAPPKPPEPVKQVVSKPKQVTQVAPAVLAVADAVPAPNAPSVQPITPPAPYVPTVVVAAAAAPAPPAAPAVPKIELPSSEAYWLKNAKPVRSVMSKKMGETGKVLIKVVIGPDGLAKTAEIHTSSGYPRLDKLALETSLIWKYAPKKVNDVPVTSDYLLPFTFQEE